MKRVLLPVDGSKNSLEAVEHIVARFLNDSHQELHLLHVRTPFSKHIARFLQRRDLAAYHTQRSRQGAQVRTRTSGCARYPLRSARGDGRQGEIASMARKLRASQIVMGTSRKSSFTRMIESFG